MRFEGEMENAFVDMPKVSPWILEIGNWSSKIRKKIHSWDSLAMNVYRATRKDEVIQQKSVQVHGAEGRQCTGLRALLQRGRVGLAPGG